MKGNQKLNHLFIPRTNFTVNSTGKGNVPEHSILVTHPVSDLKIRLLCTNFSGALILKIMSKKLFNV